MTTHQCPRRFDQLPRSNKSRRHRGVGVGGTSAGHRRRWRFAEGAPEILLREVPERREPFNSRHEPIPSGVVMEKPQRGRGRRQRSDHSADVIRGKAELDRDKKVGEGRLWSMAPTLEPRECVMALRTVLDEIRVLTDPASTVQKAHECSVEIARFLLDERSLQVDARRDRFWCQRSKRDGAGESALGFVEPPVRITESP